MVYHVKSRRTGRTLCSSFTRDGAECVCAEIRYADYDVSFRRKERPIIVEAEVMVAPFSMID